MNNYYMFSQNYKQVTERNKNKNSHYDQITATSDFGINLNGQLIDYIFIAFGDSHIVWKITAPDQAKIIYSNQASKEISEFISYEAVS